MNSVKFVTRWAATVFWPELERRQFELFQHVQDQRSEALWLWTLKHRQQAQQRWFDGQPTG